MVEIPSRPKLSKASLLHGAIAPLCFSLVPVLSLYSGNIWVIYFTDVLPTLGLVAVVALLTYLVMALGMRDSYKASLIVSGFVLVFFLYGAFFPPPPPPLIDGPEAAVALPWDLTLRYVGLLLVYLVLVLVVMVTNRPLAHVSRFVAVTALSILGVTIVGIGVNLFSMPDEFQRAAAASTSVAGSSTPAERLPDIYYIILDGYAREDVLRTIYGLDNSPFLDGLRARGFYIASESRSNYMMTAQSLASTLNFEYLDPLAAQMGDAYTRLPLQDMIKDNRVVEILKGSGYLFVTVSSDVVTTTPMDEADISITNRSALGFGEFGRALLSRTPFMAFNWVETLNPVQLHGDHVRFQFDTLKALPRYDRPTFVFTHIISPHPPFLFDEHGNRVSYESKPETRDGSHYRGTSSEYRTGYTRQLQFVNQETLAAVDHILSLYPPEERPIIILQADHGPGLKVDAEDPENSCLWERASILNAYLLPEDRQFEIYDSITPVNTFPVILNGLLNTGLERLPDKVYYAPWRKPYAFVFVSDERLARDEAEQQQQAQ